MHSGRTSFGLLHVRGKTSGTKLIEPKSGKIIRRPMIKRCVLVIALTIFFWVNRAPAPIVEQEEKPAATATAAAEKSEAPKRKHSTRSISTEQSPSEQTETRTRKSGSAAASIGPARFAGTWTGKINQGMLGHVASSITVDANAASVQLSHNLGGNTRSATINGNSLTWKSGVAGEINWTLIPNSDGQTAQVTMKGMVLNDTTTFRRGQSK